MGGIGAVVLNVLTGGLAQKFLDAWVARDKAKFDALNSTEQRAFEDRQNARATAKEIRLATASFWEMRLITFLIAGTFALHVVLVGLDTSFALGWKIDKFPPPFDEWEGLIILSFFGVQVAGNVTRTVAATAVIKARRALTWGGRLG